ncbi:gp53-like domain-containing protein [Escherichia coli]|uniref:gp53-like domain-containing protein n=2 Tax=Enterobacteriaceae TaxID=543 RepID=UPI00201CB01C|nr:carbohydrate-binding protein [Escherichia coli]
MSKIVRYQGDVRAFASDAQGMERTVFGGTNQADDLTSQITASFLRGWGIVGASEHPSLEDFNAAMYAMSQFIAYQHQMGVPEWHAEQEYHIGSICTHNGESYQSLQNANIGSQPPSAKWTPVLTSKNGLANLGLGELSLAGTASGVIGLNGYVTIPLIISGSRRTLIIQWGQARFGGSGGEDAGYLNDFPFAFPSACYGMIVSHVGHTPSGAGILSASAITSNQFRGFSSIATAANAVLGRYIAIGV